MPYSENLSTPRYTDNGAHGIVFRSLEGKLLMVLRAPKSPGGKERAHIFGVNDTGDSLLPGKALFLHGRRAGRPLVTAAALPYRQAMRLPVVLVF